MILARHLSNVVLPEPFDPITPSISPSSTLRLTPFSAQNSWYFVRRLRIVSFRVDARSS